MYTLKSKIGTYLLLLAAGMLLCYFTVGTYYRKLVDHKDQIIALQEASRDSLVTYYDSKLNEVVSERSALIAEKEVLDKYLKKKEAELYELRKRKAEVGIITRTETKIDTVVQVVRDTATKEVFAIIDRMPHYVGNIRHYGDSLDLKLDIYNIQSYELLPTGKLRVINSNPYIHVTELNSFYVKPTKQKNRFWLGVATGAGAVIGGLLLTK